MHRKLEDGTMVEVTSPRSEPVASAAGLTVPWHWIGSGALALLGVGVGGGTIFDTDRTEFATKEEVAKLQGELVDLHKDVLELHEDIDDVNKILNQIVTTKIILKESP
jgi:hypothetical protein